MRLERRVEVYVAITEGRLSIEAAAETLGVSEIACEAGLEAYRVHRALQARTWARVGKGVVLATLTVAGASVWWSPPAWAQAACTQTLPAPLVTFCPDTPALASEVNDNFAGVVGFITSKVGAVASPDVTTRDISARNITTTGTVTTPTATVTTANLTSAVFGSQTRQHVNLYGTQYGIGIQSSTLYARTGGGFAWYLNGSHHNDQWNSGGGSSLMTLDSAGNLTAAGQLAAGSIRQANCAWGARGPHWNDDSSYHTVYCPPGKHMAGWQCKANGYLDGDCAAYCCTP